MTIRNETVTLWDDGKDRLELFAVPPEEQYRYVDGQPCITVGVAYENAAFKGRDVFTVFGGFCEELSERMRTVLHDLNGTFRLYDAGADTDGFLDFTMTRGRLLVAGRLGASVSTHSLTFQFAADQTLLAPLIRSLTV